MGIIIFKNTDRKIVVNKYIQLTLNGPILLDQNHDVEHNIVSFAAPIVQMTGPNGQRKAEYVQVDKLSECSYMCSYQVTEPGS